MFALLNTIIHMKLFFFGKLLHEIFVSICYRENWSHLKCKNFTLFMETTKDIKDIVKTRREKGDDSYSFWSAYTSF